MSYRKVTLKLRFWTNVTLLNAANDKPQCEMQGELAVPAGDVNHSYRRLGTFRWD